MDNSIIEAMEYLGQKIGVAVDWTSETVWPQVIEFPVTTTLLTGLSC